MKHTLRLTSFFVALLALLPYQGHTVIAKPAGIIHQKQGAFAEGKATKRQILRERIGKKVARFKHKLRHWWEMVQLKLPDGKLLTSLVLLIMSIVFFALAGATSLGALFNLLGSAAVIGAVVFFVLWLTERSKIPKPIN